MSLTTGQIPRVANVPITGRVAIVNATGVVTLGSDTNGQTLLTGDATYGGQAQVLIISTDDSAIAPLVHFYIKNGSDITPIGTVNVPVSSGNTLAAKLMVNALDGANILGLRRDNNNNIYIPLGPGDILKCGVLSSAPTSGKTVWIKAYGANFQA